MSARILLGDAAVRMAEMDAASIDACVTDPPAGISFMGRGWDGDKGGRRQWVAWMTGVFTEVHRVLKPGAHGLVWALPRTSHWTAWALEDAGFEVRDCIYHLTGQGFPKSLDVSKAIDKQRQDNPAWQKVGAWLRSVRSSRGLSTKTVCESIGAHGAVNHGGAVSNWENGLSCPTWNQWLALKGVLDFGDEMDAEVWRLNGRKGQPGEAWYEREIIGSDTKARSETGRSALPTMGAAVKYESWNITAAATDAARQWQGWGTALKPAAECWWLIRKPLAGTVARNVLEHGTGALNIDACRIDSAVLDSERRTSPRSGERASGFAMGATEGERHNAAGRWPANVVLDEVSAALLDEQSGERKSGSGRKSAGKRTDNVVFGKGLGYSDHADIGGDAGGASRFFYTAKASPAERGTYNDWPTVKPLALMRWLCRLVTPPGGTILDPFMGSGSTLIAADREGFDAIGIDSDPHAVEIATRRLAEDAGPLFGVTA